MKSAELKRILFKKNIVLFIVLFLVLTLFQIKVYVNNSATNDYDNYKYYLDKYGATWQTNYGEIEELNEQYSNLESLIIENSNQYSKGLISKEEYMLNYNYYQNLKKTSNGFQLFYKQYSLIKDSSPKNGPLIDLFFWNALVDLGETEVWILLIIIILTVTIFNIDRVSKFNKIQMTSYNGNQLFSIRIKITYYIVTISFILFKLQKIILFSNLYSLTGWNSAIQNLSVFSNSQFNISLGTYFIATTIIQYIGITSFIALSILLSSILQRAEIIVFFEISLIMLPVLIFNDQTIYTLPIIGPLYAVKYFCGSIYIDYGDFTECRFKQFTLTQIIIILFISVSLQILFLYFSRRKQQCPKK